MTGARRCRGRCACMREWNFWPRTSRLCSLMSLCRGFPDYVHLAYALWCLCVVVFLITHISPMRSNVPVSWFSWLRKSCLFSVMSLCSGLSDYVHLAYALWCLCVVFFFITYISFMLSVKTLLLLTRKNRSVFVIVVQEPGDVFDDAQARERVLEECKWVHVCMMHVCTHVHWVCARVCIECVWMSVWMSVYERVCVCVCTCVWNSSFRNVSTQRPTGPFSYSFPNPASSTLHVRPT
jgi:hypothetical protein